MSRIVKSPEAFMGGEKTNKISSETHRRFVASLPCLVCGLEGSTQCAHVRLGSSFHGKPETGAGTKPGDQWTVPLCVEHHALQHSMGERLFWQSEDIDPLVIAALLWAVTGSGGAGLRIIRGASAFPAAATI